MEHENIILPHHQWLFYERIIKTLGENEEPKCSHNDLIFLQNLELITTSSSPKLTEHGKSYFENKFIRLNDSKPLRILERSLLVYPPAQAIAQLLWGVKNSKWENALAVLKNRGFWRYINKSPLTNLLLIMNSSGLIVYSKRTKTIRVIKNPVNADAQVPSNIFIEPSKPYSNIVMLKKALSSCTGYIYWLDKHFQKEALEILWEAVDPNRINEISILSLNLGGKNLNSKAKRDYGRLKTEFLNRGVKLNWYVIDSKLIRDTHDRWILGENLGWNVPNVNSIISGQRSEIMSSSNYKSMAEIFNEYLKNATELSVKTTEGPNKQLNIVANVG